MEMLEARPDPLNHNYIAGQAKRGDRLARLDNLHMQQGKRLEDH